MTADDHAASSADHYRREREPCSPELSSELGRITTDIDDLSRSCVTCAVR